MAINPCDRSKIDNALHWWPKALPDSPLWRWIPLLLALQAQNPEGWRWKLSNQHDRQSRNLLFEVLGVAESTNTVDCDLLIVNSWKQDNGEIDASTPNQASEIVHLKKGSIILSLPKYLSALKATNQELFEVHLSTPTATNQELFSLRQDIAIYQQDKTEWLDNILENLPTLIERGIYFQRLADNNGMNLRNCIQHISEHYGNQARQQNQLLKQQQQLLQKQQQLLQKKQQLLLSYSTRVSEMKGSRSWQLSKPLRQLADQLRKQKPAGDLPTVPPLYIEDLPTIPPLYIADNLPEARSPVDAVMETSEQSKPAALLKQQGQRRHREDQKTVVVVLHEASFTGAPILAWNVINDLKDDHNIIIISLRRGSLEQELLSICTWLISPTEHHQGFDYDLASPILRELIANTTVHWALTNSIETWRWPKIMHQLGIPTVMLIHEYATYSTEQNAFRDACLWSTRVVFSSPATHADMTRVHPELANTPVELIPQGRCKIPGQKEEKQTASAPKPFQLSSIPELNQRLDGEWLDQCLLVIGSGTLAPRKGVDIFISVCNRLLQQSSQPVLCLWLAGPDRTSDYKPTRMWSDDQIRRSGIEDRVLIIHAHDNYDNLIQRADLFMLTSRLDPLPNVSLDSLHSGVPTLTFSQASGTASWLERDPWLRERCVAPYLDTETMAAQAHQLLENSEERQEVSDRVKTLAKETFSMHSYKRKIRSLGELCITSAQHQRAVIEEIIQAKVFDPDLAIAPGSAPTTNLPFAVANYLQSWERQIQMRKPCAGFHPGLFADHTQNTNGDPFYAWLQSNRPPGPWQQTVLSPMSNSNKQPKSDEQIGIHIHVHHLDLLEEIIERFAHNQSTPRLWITITDPSLQSPIEEMISNRSLSLVDIRCYPNRGRNFGPLLQGLGHELDQQCTIYAHLHTKRSQHLDAATTARWREFLLDHLLGRDGCPMMDTILEAFKRDPNLGLVYADDPHCIDWTSNQASARLLMNQLNLSKEEQDSVMPPGISTVDFPIGSMFWIRSGSLSKVWSNPWPIDAIPQEPLPSDGTVLHALERLLPGLCRNTGFQTAVTHVHGSRR